VILLDDDDSPLIVTDVVSFADLLKMTVSALPAPRALDSNIINALTSCRLICSIHNGSSDEVQDVYVSSLPTEPTIGWVCVLHLLHLSTVVKCSELLSLFICM